MVAFNLNKNVNDLLYAFDNIDFSSVVNILDWFYDMIDYNSVFEEKMISEYIYNRLAKEGYTPRLSTMENLNGLRNFLSDTDHQDPIKFGNFLLSQILLNIKEHIGIDNGLLTLVEIYNQKYNVENTSRKMMESMREYIGTDVICLGYKDGKRFFKTHHLDGLEPFKSVTLDNIKIPFIGFGIAISKISSKDGKVLYDNKNIPNNYNESDFSVIEGLHKKCFGKAYQEAMRKLY